MELHSYAKRRTTKKWSYEQKRKLVEARINHDHIFINEPRNSVLPWKKILAIAKLDDFNVYFVRKQWSNMVAKYKQFKQNRLGNIATKAIDNEMMQKITQEWEFFKPIHQFMTRKTTNLHSYALTSMGPQTGADVHHDYAKCQLPSPDQDNQASTSSIERANMCSSDTNEDFAITSKEEHVETDREFYWQHHDDYDDDNIDDTTLREEDNDSCTRALNYFADASEDTQESLIAKAKSIPHAQAMRLPDDKLVVDMIAACTTGTPTTTTVTTTKPALTSLPSCARQKDLKLLNNKNVHSNATLANEKDGSENGRDSVKSEPTENTNPNNIDQQVPKPMMTEHVTRLSEREKYYRHKRRFNRRLEQRFDSMLNVFGQIIKAEYPSIDVSPLLGAAATSTGSVLNTIFSSDDDYGQNDTDSSNDDGDAATTTAAADDDETVSGQKCQPQENGH